MEQIEEINAALNTAWDEQQQRLGEKRSREVRLASLVERRIDLEAKERLLRCVQEVFKRLLDEGQEKILRMIENVSSAMLTEVFCKPIRVYCEIIVKRGLQCLSIEVEIDGVRRDPRYSLGGGISDVLGFVLQFVIVKLTKNVAPVLVLDEPFKNVAKQYHETLGDMIERLTEATKMQVVMITHESGLVVGDKKYYIHHDGTKSVVQEMRQS